MKSLKSLSAITQVCDRTALACQSIFDFRFWILDSIENRQSKI
jgi:hypothetical protein